MIPQSGLFLSPLRIPLNKRFGWDWVLYFVFNLLEDSRKGWKKAEARVYNTLFFFLLSPKPINPSSRTQGLWFKSQSLPSQSVGRRRRRSWRVGLSFPWRPAGAPRLTGCLPSVLRPDPPRLRSPYPPVPSPGEAESSPALLQPPPGRWPLRWRR